MATATRSFQPKRQAALRLAPTGSESGSFIENRCQCGNVLRVFGVGRHRVYFEPYNTQLDHPVMNRACPACGRGLPGKNPIVT